MPLPAGPTQRIRKTLASPAVIVLAIVVIVIVAGRETRLHLVAEAVASGGTAVLGAGPANASGREIGSSFSGSGLGLDGALEATDPLLVHQIAKLTANDGATEDNFGLSIAISGDTLVVGAPYADAPGDMSGAAYLFERDGEGAWTQVKKLVAGDGASGDAFGFAVDISGDTVVVGAPYDAIDESDPDFVGSAYIFQRDAGGTGNWGQVKKLRADDAERDDTFGVSIAISGDTIVVGAEGDEELRGAVYVFERDAGGAGNWGQVKKLVPNDPAIEDSFGFSVAISGDTIVVGAPFNVIGAVLTGSAYIFERNQGGAGNWGQRRRVMSNDPADGEAFGWAVAISGDTAVVGAPENLLPCDDPDVVPGSAHVFGRNTGGAGNWGRVKVLVPEDGAAGDQFGSSVAIDGSRAVVGAYLPEGCGDDPGAAYVFERTEGGANAWGQAAKATANDGDSGDQLGASVDIEADTLVAGADLDDDRGQNSGSAYVFQLVPPPDLTISKSVSPVEAEPGDPITFTLSYSNAGLGPATGVRITDIVPITVTSPAFTSSGATITPTGSSTYAWLVADLAPGQGGVIVLTGQIRSDVTTSHTFTNTASITAVEPDESLDDNEASASVRVRLQPTPTPTNTATATATVMPTNTATGTSTATQVPSATATTPANTATSTATATQSPAATLTSTSTSAPTQTATKAPTQTATQVATQTATQAATQTATQAATATQTAASTPTSTRVPSQTATGTVVPSATIAPTITKTPAPSRTPSATPSRTPSPSATRTKVPTATATASATAMPSITTTATATPDPTGTSLPTATATPADEGWRTYVPLLQR